MMARFRARVIGSGSAEDPYRVDLPNYQMVEPLALPPGLPPKDPKRRVFVEIPDDELNGGRPSKAKIRQKYRGQPAWDRPDVCDDIEPPEEEERKPSLFQRIRSFISSRIR